MKNHSPRITLPESNGFKIEGHSYSIQPIGSRKLPVDNATKWAEAIDMVRVSEREVEPATTANNEKAASKIAKFGANSVTVALFDNEKDGEPGSPSNLIGYIQPYLAVYDEEDMHPYRPIQDWLEHPVPHLGFGPELTYEHVVYPKVRKMLKLQLIRVALNSFFVPATQKQYGGPVSFDIVEANKIYIKETNHIFRKLGATENDGIYGATTDQEFASRAMLLPNAHATRRTIDTLL